ncbi:MAG: FAD-dependent oxidoreductase [Proteobacteria bacterium]|nr:FAD-dependent oxidoreductase [Pseudomonadota bacterium]
MQTGGHPSPPGCSDNQIAIIGAGMAGLACARALSDRARNVVVFDKGRLPGGRLCSRRHQTLQFDHGAQYATVRGSGFRRAMESWSRGGAAKLWRPRFLVTGGQRASVSAPGVEVKRAEAPGQLDETSVERWVGTPAMSAIPRRLALGLSIIYSTRIRELRAQGAAWQLVGDRGDVYGPFAAVIVAVPAPQAVELLAPVPDIVKEVSRARLAPCWALMAAWQQPIAPGWNVARLEGELAWVAQNSSKPGRGDRETWVVHAAPAWSRDHLEATAEDAANMLAAALSDLLGVGAPDLAIAHRWRYALVERPIGEPYIYQPGRGIGACGDWCHGPRVEAAFESGLALAERIVQS